MEFTVNVNISAPELTAALLKLADAISTKTTECTKDQSQFSFPMTKNESPPDTNTDTEQPQEEPTVTFEQIQKTLIELAQAGKQSEEPTVTFEQIQKTLSELAQAGKQSEVKKLVKSFGVAKISAIPEEKYAELLAAAKEL